MLGIPSATPYDLRFTFLRIPVRVHPLFWLVTAVLGNVGATGVDVTDVLIFVGCAFVSILAHEYGHGLATRAMGYSASIVLYGMGGLCYSDGERQRPGHRLVILISGPLAGFGLAGIALLVAFGAAWRGVDLGPVGSQAVGVMFTINLFWNILNLLPVWPLDGGQITAVLLGMASPRNGQRWAHVIGLLSAGIMAVVGYLVLQDAFLAIFFGMFAIMNFQILQVLHAKARYGTFGDEDDWWRR